MSSGSWPRSNRTCPSISSHGSSLGEAVVPKPIKQKPIYVGKRLRRLDFLFPDYKVVIEADGYAHHSTPAAFEKDRRRNNSLITRGFRVLHWTWSALHQRPAELITDLCTVLARAA